MSKPWYQVPIEDCGEPLLPIPHRVFALLSPHPYQKLGATYPQYSPYHLRQRVLEALHQAQEYLQIPHPGYRLQIFDAYRPVEVQRFMVNHTYQSLLPPHPLTPEETTNLWERVYQIWAQPNENPATPPPHSTGAAVDLTIVDEEGNPLNMGSAIDELSPRSAPDYYKNQQPEYHEARELLWTVMTQAGFTRHPGEWWHFSIGDQMWAWQKNSQDPMQKVTAYYGRIGEVIRYNENDWSTG